MSATPEGEVYDPSKFEAWLKQAMSDADVPNLRQLGHATRSSPTTVYRWIDTGPSGARPAPKTLRVICEALKADLLLAYVSAGYLSEEEAGLGPERGLNKYSSKEILKEMLKRVD